MEEHRGRWTLDDRLERSMREVPFEVPAGTYGVTVRLSYDRSAGVLDLGCAGPGGFRGWSGGAREEFTVAADAATPGYLKGDLEPGVWQVWLRLHRIPPEGLDYTITITLHTSPRDHGIVQIPDDRDLNDSMITGRGGREIPGVEGARWLAGDFHAHTVHSDGTLTVTELARLAASRGLDFLAVTDHNTISHHAELDAVSRRTGVRLVPGQEVTTDLGHANVFGDVGWVDFRRPADDWVRHATDNNGYISINHPVAADCAWREPITDRPRIAEVWHWSWFDRTWGAPLAWAQAWHPEIVVIGGSDFHFPGDGRDPGEPTTWVLTDGDPLDGLRASRTAISAGPDAPLLLRMAPDELLALDADGTVLVRPDGGRVRVRGGRATLKAEEGMHRLESHRNEVIALCG